MWSKIKLELKAIWIIFLVSFLTFGVLAPLSMLLVNPLINWWRFGVLHFPIGRSELFKLSEIIFILSVGSTLSIWLLGKIDKRKG